MLLAIKAIFGLFCREIRI